MEDKIEPIIRIKNLTKVFGKNPKKAMKYVEAGLNREEIQKKTGNTVGIKNVNLEINQGEVFVIMGLSGSGKSSLIRCLNLLNRPTKGEILIDNEDIVKYEKKQLRELRQNKVSMVFQNFGLFNHRNVIENVEFGLEIKGISKEERFIIAKKTLENVGLAGWEDHRISQLSGGMKQRVGLARALANDPSILLMDEPFSALDPLIRTDMHDELLNIQSEIQKTIVFITHDVNEAFKLGDRIAVLKDGEMIQCGTPEEIIESPVNDYIERFIKGIDRSKVFTSVNVMKKVKVKLNANTDARIAMDVMNAEGVDFGYVVDKERKYLGVVSVDDCIAAQKTSKKIYNFVNAELEAVREDTIIADILPIATKSQYPIPVINDKQRLVGVIPRIAILKALA